jgi:hypothetical protein
MVLAVPICSIRNKYDSTCVLKASDHRNLLKNDSYVAYYHLETYAAKVLEDQAEKGILKAHEMLDGNTLARICDGVQKSRQSAPIYQRYFAYQTRRFRK